MKIVQKNVYYCEYCKKKSLRKDVIQKHEIYCTMNPGRRCKICEMGEFETKPLSELLELTKKYNKLEVIDNGYGYAIEVDGSLTVEEFEEIRGFVGICPCCLMAVIKQNKLHPPMGHWKFREEMESFLRSHYNSSEAIEYWQS